MFEIGTSLRDARVKQGLDFADLEADTKIRAKYLRALEEEQFHLLPGETYVRGFLRLYAERLGLDGQLYLDEYQSRFAGGEEPPPASGARRRRQASRGESRAVLLALAGILAVTMLVIVAWRFGTGNAERQTPPVAEPQGAAGPAPTTSAGTLPEVAPGVTLLVSAPGGRSRLEVRRNGPTGELLFEGTLEKGQTSQPFKAQQLWLDVSRPRNLTFTIDGLPVQRPDVRGPSALVATAKGLRAAPTP